MRSSFAYYDNDGIYFGAELSGVFQPRFYYDFIFVDLLL